MQGEWIVPFKARSYSGHFILNFLWKCRNIYIMDNHRAAMWCWLQNINKDQKVNLLHIDRHTDTLILHEEWKRKLPTSFNAFKEFSLEEYLQFSIPCNPSPKPFIKWDTYLSVFLECYSQNVNKCVFVVDEGDEPRIEYTRISSSSMPFHKLLTQINYWLSNSSEKWIVDIDLDYFFDSDGKYMTGINDSGIINMSNIIKRHLELGKIAVLTICLSPDEGYSGSWDRAEYLCAKICNSLGIELPSLVEN